ncbi:hypothetical protein, partial [Photobacterium damselae]|uniref:hypothetical protein n=1 Tax=Photobacterium damselae TaxID=38293 RepID=UPI001C6336BA
PALSHLPQTFSSLFSRSPYPPLFLLSPAPPLSYKAKLTQSFLFRPNILQQLFFLHEYLINQHTLKTVNKSR